MGHELVSFCPIAISCRPRKECSGLSTRLCTEHVDEFLYGYGGRGPRRETHVRHLMSWIAIFSMFAAMPASAQWAVQRTVDPASGAEIRAATADLPGGETVTVLWSGPGQRVLMVFTIPESAGVLHPERILRHQVDDEEAQHWGEVNQMLAGTGAVGVKPHVAGNVIGHGRDASGTFCARTVQQLVHGRVLHIRYFLYAGGHRDVSVGLDDLGSALVYVFGEDGFGRCG